MANQSSSNLASTHSDESPAAQNTPAVVEHSNSHRDSIAIYWHIDDVNLVRPDLCDRQAANVLQACEDGHDAEIGINWSVLEDVADLLYPQ